MVWVVKTPYFWVETRNTPIRSHNSITSSSSQLGGTKREMHRPLRCRHVLRWDGNVRPGSRSTICGSSWPAIGAWPAIWWLCLHDISMLEIRYASLFNLHNTSQFSMWHEFAGNCSKVESKNAKPDRPETLREASCEAIQQRCVQWRSVRRWQCDLVGRTKELIVWI